MSVPGEYCSLDGYTCMRADDRRQNDSVQPAPILQVPYWLLCVLRMSVRVVSGRVSFEEIKLLTNIIIILTEI